MAPMYDALRVRLIQIRERAAIEFEEQQTFLERCALRPDQLVATNVLKDPIHEGLLDEVDALFIGGAGAYSVAEDYPWTKDLARLVQDIYDRRLPLFGSCWGHQFIARALGGTVVNDPERAELGCFPVELTEAGQQDELFGTFPSRFMANMGHHDRVLDLPEEAVELAFSAVAPYQAFRVGDRPIYGTQFHSELDACRTSDRMVAYRSYYPELNDDRAFEATLATLTETTEVDSLLQAFLHTFAVKRTLLK